MTIEFIHTDAEGRMVLADMLTGSITAVSDRISGVITNRTELATKASDAGSRSGECIVTFPYDDNFDSDLGSAVVDIKKCTLDSEADHIHAEHFLGKFIENETPWIHTDLSSTNYIGG